jgi:hypothetical protein
MPEEMPRRIEMIHKDAVDNLRFIKQQEWTVTNYALAAYAALFAVAHIAKDATPWLRIIVIAAIILVAAYSVAILAGFIDSLDKFRDRMNWIYEKYFECEERVALGLRVRKGLFNRVGFAAVLILVSLTGAALASIAVWCWAA